MESSIINNIGKMAKSMALYTDHLGQLHTMLIISRHQINRSLRCYTIIPSQVSIIDKSHQVRIFRKKEMINMTSRLMDNYRITPSKSYLINHTTKSHPISQFKVQANISMKSIQCISTSKRRMRLITRIDLKRF